MLVKLAFNCHAKIEKISQKNVLMINKDGGGGQFLDFMGDHSCYEGDIELMGVPLFPPTRENPVKSSQKKNIHL